MESIEIQETRMKDTFRSGDFEAVIAIADQILDAAPNHVAALQHKARVLNNARRFDDVLPVWKALAEVAPEIAESHLQLARLAQKNGDWNALISHGERYLAANPEHAEILSLLIQGYVNAEATDKLEPAFTRFARVQPQGVTRLARQAANRGMVGEIVAPLRSLAETGDEAAKALCRTLAKEQREAGLANELKDDVYGAAACYRNMRALDPTSDYPITSLRRLRKPYLEHARQDFAAERDAAAFKNSMVCIEIDPTEAEPYVIAGRSLHRIGDYQEAYDVLAKAMATCSPDPWLTVNFARAAMRADKALAAWHAFSEIRRGRRKAERSFHEEADRALERLPQRIAREAQLLAQSGNSLRAIEAMGMISENRLLPEPDYTVFHTRVTNFAQRELREAYDGGDSDKALELGNALILFAPDASYAYRVVGRLQMRGGDYETALDCWQKLTELQPDSADFHLNVARCQERLQRGEAAAEAALRVLGIEPDHAEARRLAGAAGEQDPSNDAPPPVEEDKILFTRR